MRLPEHMTLVQCGRHLSIQDAQEVEHVTFRVAIGDPTQWSRNVVLATSSALGVTDCYSLDDGDEITIDQAIDRWHKALGAEDGFIPHDEPDMDTEIGWAVSPGDPR